MSRKSNNPTLIGLTQQLKPDLWTWTTAFLKSGTSTPSSGSPTASPLRPWSNSPDLGVNNTENDAAKEPEDEAQWASAEGDDQPGSDDAYASF